MHNFAKRFVNEHYAVMRHAMPYDSAEGTELVPASAAICRSVARDLAKSIREKKVVIFHSRLSRARLTAELVAEELRLAGIETSITPLDELRNGGGKLSNLLIVPQMINPDEFCLFVAHFPELKTFLGLEEHAEEPVNCTIIARDFLVSGNR